MNDQDLIKSLANTLISQYGDDAEAVAMLRAAENAADLNNEEWMKWEKVIMEKFLAGKNSTVDYLDTIDEIKDIVLAENPPLSLRISIATVFLFTFILALLNAALGLG